MLGYSLLPIVTLAAVNVLLSLKGALGAVLGCAAVLWATVAATRIFETALDMRAQRYIVAYPVLLLYVRPRVHAHSSNRQLAPPNLPQPAARPRPSASGPWPRLDRPARAVLLRTYHHLCEPQ